MLSRKKFSNAAPVILKRETLWMILLMTLNPEDVEEVTEGHITNQLKNQKPQKHQKQRSLKLQLQNQQPHIMICAMNFLEICKESSAGLKNIWLNALTPNQRKTVQTKPVRLKTELNSSKNGKKLSAPSIMEQLTSPTDLSANVNGKLPIIKTS